MARRRKSLNLKYDNAGRLTSVSGGSRRARNRFAKNVANNHLTETGLKALKSNNRAKLAQNAMNILAGASGIDDARRALVDIFGKEAAALTNDQISQLIKLAQANSGQNASSGQNQAKPQAPTSNPSNGTSKGVYIS